MRIKDLLKRESIELHGSASSKSEAIDKMVELMYQSGNIKDKDAYKKAVYVREKEGTTGIGEGIAIPHAKTDAVVKAGLSAMVVKSGVDFESLDGKPVDLIFLIAAPNSKDNIHIDVLSRLSVLLMDEGFTNGLRNANSVDDFLSVLDKEESKKEQEEKAKESAKESHLNHEREASQHRILAVTACPTGIAHTFMAAESLEKKGKELGYTLKVETNGSGGDKNVLTKDDIENCDGILVAADKDVEMSRFDGKPVLVTSVSSAINKPEELLNRMVNEEIPVYHHTGVKAANESFHEEEGVGRRIYKHLMNGVSHMLPFVVGGGILVALAFLFDNYEINPENFGSNTPLAAFFMVVGGQAFNLMIPVLAGYIAMSIAERPGLAVGFVGGMLASSGYTFGSLIHGSETVLVSSGFIGALIAGFAGGYIVVLLRKIFAVLPKSLEGIKPVLLYPLFGILLVGLFMFSINPIVSSINLALDNFLASMGNTSRIVMGALLGGMMSIDMGGPVNKAAYVFGTAQLTMANAGADQFAIMAAVMVGGMVPPLAIALCTTFFKNRFTEEERKSGIVNYIMGLSFITEGAIPFAAADPLRVLPSCIIGSALAGALSMAFGSGIRAPHGGIFVLAVIYRPFMYLLALLIGSFVGAALMAMLKKPIPQSEQ